MASSIGISHWSDYAKTQPRILVGLLVLVSGSLFAKTGALRVEDAVMPAEIAHGSSLAFSQDSRFVAYAATRAHFRALQTAAAGVPWFAHGADIHVIDLTTNAEENITAGTGNNWESVWCPQRNVLAFLSDRGSGGKIHLWLWDAQERALKMASSLEVKADAIEWMKDGRGLVFSRPSPLESKPGVPKRQTTPNVSDIRVYESAGTSAYSATADPWDLDEYSAELVWIDLAAGRNHSIFRGKVGTYKLSPDNSRIAISSASRFEQPGSQQILFDVVILSLATGERQTVLSNIRLPPDGSGFSWSPDSRQLFVQLKNVTTNVYSYTLVNLEKADIFSLLGPMQPSSGHEGTEPIWDHLRKSIYFVHAGELWRGDTVQRTSDEVARISGRQITEVVGIQNDSVIVLTHDDDGKQDGIYAVNLVSGANRKLMEEGQCYTCTLDRNSLLVDASGQKIAFVAEDAAHSPELWMADLQFKSLQQLTHLNPQFDSNSMGKARLIDWLSDDGERLHGALLLPPNYEEAKPCPLLVYVYGGVPLSDHFDRFGLAGPGPINMQLLATRGYAVLLPDAPQHMGTPMLDLAKAILPGVNKAIELGIADPNRLAIMGHSYGGYTTLSVIVQTGRFKAAISMAGDSDLVGFYGEMQDDASAYGVAIAERGQGGMGGTPWERRERYIENSPFFYFDRIKTPLLIVQGSIDTAVSPFLADQIFVALRRLGKETEYARYVGEDHSPWQEWSYDHQVDLGYRIIRWLDTHLK